MVDLHMHTIYSDGTKSVEEVLKICEEKKLKYISITDHNTCKQYEDKALKNNNIFSGKIIKGVEMNATFQNRSIEVLAYNIVEPKIIESWSKRFFSEEKLKQKHENVKRRLLDICSKKGLIYDESKIEKNISLTDFSIYSYYELMRHEENIAILGEFANSLDIFIRKGLMNPNSEFYTGVDDIQKPMYKDVVDVIHKAGGKAFLAHPFEYRFSDTISFIDELRKEKELDGIECYHPSANDNEINILIKYSRKNNLYISGGSDYHGSKKPGIEIGMENIPKEIIEEWIEK